MAGEQDKGGREVSPEDKALSADWLKRIASALARPSIKEAFKTFERNRKLLRGVDPDRGDAKMRANLHFANLAMMRPQVYAKDPEYAVTPTKGVPEEQLGAVRRFAETAEAVLHQCLVKDARLKKRAKRLLTSAYATSVGWWKLCWQEDKRTDPVIANQIKDTQDNLMRLQRQLQEMDDPQAGTDHDKQIGELKQLLAGLEQKAEVVVARGLTLDFVLSEDILIIDQSVRELGDYERAGAIGHRIWMTREQYKLRFGYDCDKGKGYTEQAGQMAAAGQALDRKDELLCVWEVWDQDTNRVLHVCEGEEGFCDPPHSPDWTGQRWYPFFGVAFNEIDGTFYPLSDIELTEMLVREYNDARSDFVRDRKAALPLNIARKGGTLTDEDLKRIKDREGGDVILVEGVGAQSISNDLWSGQLAQIDPKNYDTAPARADIEQIIGGGDAARGSILSAKTATEAEILSQGLRSRSAERQDTMEDLLSEVGTYALQVCLRKMTTDEVKRVAGPQATWPEMSTEQVFEQVTVEVRGGSTGKPDRLQEQDRWTKLLPVIEKTMERVAALRVEGQDALANAVIELTRETLRRFDERLDLQQFLPPAPKGEEGEQQPQGPDPQQQQLMQRAQEVVSELQARIQELEQELADKTAEREATLEKARIDAEATVAVGIEKARIDGETAIRVAQIQAGAKVGEVALSAALAPDPAPTEEPGEPQEPQPA